MDAIVGFFEKFVSEFSWRRLTLVVAIAFIAIVSIWVYEAYTGYFQSSRMEFAAQQLIALADPDLRKNIQGDVDLEHAHQMLKTELNTFLSSRALSYDRFEGFFKGLAASIPWFIFGFILFLASDKRDVGKMLAGLTVVALPFILVGAMLPNFTWTWVNYVLYPFVVVVLTAIVAFVWQIKRPTT